MTFHNIALIVRKARKLLFQNNVGHADFSDVMELRRNLKVIAELMPFLLRNVVVERPAVVNFKRNIRNTLYVRIRFLRVTEFRHLEHTPYHILRVISMLQSLNGSRSKMTYIKFRIIIKRNDISGFVLRIDYLKNAKKLSARHFKRNGIH